MHHFTNAFILSDAPKNFFSQQGEKPGECTQCAGMASSAKKAFRRLAARRNKVAVFCEKTAQGAHACYNDEEKRKLYVGMTRAKDQLILTYAKEPSPFLEDIPEELALKEKAGKQRQEISGEQMNLFDFLKE